MIDDASGKPLLCRQRAKPGDPSVPALEQVVKERMPERTLLEILARTAYWLACGGGSDQRPGQTPSSPIHCCVTS